MRTCGKCGAKLTGAGPAGLCPRCFLQEGLARAEADSPPAPGTNPPPASGTQHPKVHYFGDYELLQEIACGGMGIVYKARQVSLHRIVAVKMILAGQLASEAAVKRFHTEAEAAAGLDHPNIVSIYEVGQHEGQHYFSMQFVEGPNLSQHVASRPNRFSPQEAARLLVSVARAVHYAHQRGILHRDLKPANILMDAHGQPHVTDFGLAKVIAGDSNLTLSGIVMGTPNFMSPEQAAGKVNKLTTATDIYSLGAVLYFLLAGRPPFEGATPLETMRKVAEEEPVPPSRVTRGSQRQEAQSSKSAIRNPQSTIDNDLETICLKCLEKDPARRYASADALADDLEHWLRHEPIRARPCSRREQVAKWVKRNPALAGWAIAAIVVAMIGVAGIVWQWRRADRSAERELLRLEFERADTLFAQDRTATAVAQLARLLRRHPDNRVIARWLLSALSELEPDRSLTASSGNLTKVEGGELRSSQPLALDFAYPQMKPGGSGWAEFSQDGQKILTVSADFTVRVWDARTGQPVSKPMLHWNSVRLAHFSPDGSLVATASADASARVWDVLTGEPLTPPMQHGDRIFDMRFSPDGIRIVTASADGTARIWEAATGRPVGRPLQHRKDAAASAEADEYAAEFGENADLEPSDVLMTRFSANGQRVATTCRDGAVWVWDPATSGLVVGPLAHQVLVAHIRFSPDGSRLASVCVDGTARVWDLGTGQPVSAPIPHLKGLAADSPGLSPDGSKVVVLSHNTAQILDLLSGKPRGNVMANSAVLVTAQFNPEGTCVALGSVDGTARIWDVQTALPVSRPLRHGGEVLHAEFSPDGQWLLTASSDGKARLWEVLAAPAPIPRWLPDLAEAVVGQHVAENDVREPVSPGQLRSLRQRLIGSPVALPDYGLQGWNGGSDISWAARVPYTLGWRFRVNREISVNALGVYILEAEWTANHQVGLWMDSGTPLADVTVTTLDPEVNQVRWVNLSNSLQLSAGQTYRIGASYPGPATDYFHYRAASVAVAPEISYLTSADNQGSGFSFPGQLGGDRCGYFGPNFQFASPSPPPAVSGGPLRRPNGDLRLAVPGTANRPPTLQTTADADTDFYTRWAKWFFAPKATRTLSPSSSIIVREYVRRPVEKDTLENLPERARLLAEQAVQLDPKDWRNFRLLGMARYRAGQFTGATEAFQAEGRLRNGRLSPQTLFYLALTHHQLGQTNQARGYFRQAETWWKTNFEQLDRSRAKGEADDTVDTPARKRRYGETAWAMQIAQITELEAVYARLGLPTQAQLWALRSEAERVLGMPMYKHKWKVVSVSYEVPWIVGRAAGAIDENPVTLWHTCPREGEHVLPQEIIVDLGEMLELTAFTYLPRPDESPDGIVDQYEFYLSTDGKVWNEPVAKGTLTNLKANRALRTVPFARPVTARYFRFVGLHAISANHLRVAELGVVEK